MVIIVEMVEEAEEDGGWIPMVYFFLKMLDLR